MSHRPEISASARTQTLAALESESFDLVIIGGGITGAGLAREATLRGLSVALLEARDFASGTSSRSSKLIHGGLRYLAMGDVGLVRETALERKVIFRLAPHLAERRWMVLPTRSRTGLLKFRAAVAAYEKLGAVAEEDTHSNWGASELEREEPLIDRGTYPYACAYREYLTDDARLVVANLRAAAESGARVLNYAEADGISLEGGKVSAVEAECRLTQRRVRIRASCVVNAAGPWVEAVRRLEQPTAKDLLHLSKGVHICLPAARVPLRNILLLNCSDGRSIFAIPQGEVVYVGTTDTSWHHGPTLWPDITAQDVEYLLEPLPRYLNVDPLQPSDVTAAWSGLRPLVAQPGKKPKDISRKDEILVGESGVVTVAGGKLTGYRRTVERILDSVGEVLGRELADVDEAPLPGGDFDGDLARLAGDLSERFRLEPDLAARLSRLYGTEAEEIVRLGDTALAEGTPVLSGEVDWAVLYEGAARVEDVIYRRTRTALYEPETGNAIVDAVATRMASLLDWTRERTADEAAQTRKRLQADLTFAERDV